MVFIRFVKQNIYVIIKDRIPVDLILFD